MNKTTKGILLVALSAPEVGFGVYMLIAHPGPATIGSAVAVVLLVGLIAYFGRRRKKAASLRNAS
ncbi:MAG: LPXTG cell wall anchor domain-containing protein [Alphaproteobacteria bacterium]|nr:LPXTG cell wall anchor domain-containing protein [Alphaproteobacteria bacterium]MDE2493652.1 LPXTG cell wall anchor domain-containing protein [Alphaproteobacteria bacterium]